MKNRIKLLLTVLALLLVAVCITACSSEVPYEQNGNTVNVKYDANGGIFTTNTSCIVDTYQLSTVPVDRNGNYRIPLVDPNDDIRSEENSFLASKSGYFLAGWYTEREPICDEDGNQLDADGNIASVMGTEPAYRYSGKWDFENDFFTFSSTEDYSKNTTVLTLYAAWVPNFTFEFYDRQTGEFLEEYAFDPIYVDGVKTPEWDDETGKLDMHDFPKVDGKTYLSVYYDAHGAQRITDDVVVHTGTLDFDTATAYNPRVKLYVDYNDGAWYNIYSAEQFAQMSDLSGNYNILADLDFADEDWPDAFVYGEFTGSIRGNGHTFDNISFSQGSASKGNAGLFGTFADGALVENLTFDNVQYLIETGSRLQGSSFGLFCGEYSDGAVVDNLVISGKITVTPTPYITKSTSIGLFCGSGVCPDIDITGIRIEALPPESDYDAGISLTVNGNNVTITEIPPKKD